MREVMMTGMGPGNFSAIRSQFLRCYDELSKMARQKLRSEYQSSTLDTAALVHEAYLKMDGSQKGYADKNHFLAIAAIVMRRFLVDYARQKKRQKRGGDQIQLTYGSANQAVMTSPEEVLQLNDALNRLKALNNRHCRVVEFHFFGGYKHEEIAEMMGVSIDTVRRDWRLAKAWLSKELKN
ncbi:ECF-type sigma factor [Algoriphagus sp. NF]|jgi:RNA polymerase sigma factor (TIGR02999 family)|uniref:Sigma-70 family RNA polymerase sigma factor n=3 Tax=Algoriphagus TaxID=246875 RepID=A0ABS7N0I9_9BACT|nr:MULTISPECIES: ECF-type sigma factor [Algoriphagus]KPQ19919.1 MAG: TIGR02999 family RNA polymerase sigma subunit [Algoriphagus marincola HL-49]MCR9081820.1 ECF-type sigma factor [Cyclobacteriaceae bacterium]MBY5949824.1 sigma-70 family RNA polymerase sigma factor [Algoriphagus marincola]MDE0558934.1 ECF-type sigma factor [Algoriphagus sp. NF]TDK41942.1 sigma-70 family RNA polymerase sigma factor [Algoriphagus aquimaris]